MTTEAAARSREPGRARVVSALGTLWLLGGLVYPLLALASDSLTSLQVTAVRTTGAALMTTPLMATRLRGGARTTLTGRLLWPNVVAAVAFYPVGNGLLTFASARMPSSITALAFSLLPVLAAVVGAVRGVRMGSGVWLGIATASASMVVVVGATGAGVQVWPLLAALASVGCWFAGTEYWSRRGRDIDLVVSVWLQLVIGSIACWGTLALTGTPAPAAEAWVQPVMLLLAFSQFVQHAAYLGVAGRVSPVLLTSFAFVNPVVAAIAGYLLLGQRLTLGQVLASVVLLLAVSAVVRGTLRQVPHPRHAG